MAYCQNCGNWLTDDSRFCDKCGTPQNNPPQAPPDSAVTIKKSNRKLLFIILSIILFLAIIFYAFFISPKLTAKRLLNDYFNSFVNEDVDLFLSTMPDYYFERIIEENRGDEERGREDVESSLSWVLGVEFEYDYGENVSAKFTDIKCEKVDKRTLNNMEDDVYDKYKSYDIKKPSITSAYKVSFILDIGGDKRSQKSSCDNIYIAKINGKWCFYQTPDLSYADE